VSSIVAINFSSDVGAALPTAGQIHQLTTVAAAAAAAADACDQRPILTN